MKPMARQMISFHLFGFRNKVSLHLHTSSALARESGEQCAQLRSQFHRTGPRRRTLWTSAEDARITAKGSSNDRRLSEALRRSAQAIQRRVKWSATFPSRPVATSFAVSTTERFSKR
jgi:hypothetical protein